MFRKNIMNNIELSPQHVNFILDIFSNKTVGELTNDDFALVTKLRQLHEEQRGSIIDNLHVKIEVDDKVQWIRAHRTITSSGLRDAVDAANTAHLQNYREIKIPVGSLLKLSDSANQTDVYCSLYNGQILIGKTKSVQQLIEMVSNEVA